MGHLRAFSFLAAILSTSLPGLAEDSARGHPAGFVGSFTPEVLDRLVLDGVAITAEEYNLIMSNFGTITCFTSKDKVIDAGTAILGETDSEIITAYHVLFEMSGEPKVPPDGRCDFWVKSRAFAPIDLDLDRISSARYANTPLAEGDDLVKVKLVSPLSGVKLVPIIDQPLHADEDIMVVSTFTTAHGFNTKTAFVRTGKVDGAPDLGKCNVTYRFYSRDIVGELGQSGSPVFARDRSGNLVIAGIYVAVHSDGGGAIFTAVDRNTYENLLLPYRTLYATDPPSANCGHPYRYFGPPSSN